MSLYVEGQAADDSVPIFMARKPDTDSAFCNATILSRFAREAFETKPQYFQCYDALFGEIVMEPEEEGEEQEDEEEQEKEEQEEEDQEEDEK